MQSPIHRETAAGVMTVAFARPEKKNAVTTEMYQLLIQAFEEARDSSDVRVVLLRGEGDAFTAGNDLSDFHKWPEMGRRREDIPVFQFIKTVVNFPKPIVAAVKGVAVGLGSTILPHCDLVIAGKSTRFSLPFVRLALVPEFGSSFMLPRMAGFVRASHWLMLGETFDAEEARRLGLVSEICEDDQVDTLARQRCDQLVALPASVLRRIKSLIRPPEFLQQLNQAIDRETQMFLECLQTPEHAEAVQAFFEKRSPDFRRFE
ncbi:MAG: enoyl-CoA hydratase [Calditrichaeota bacterium]|nr:enoyl-CoA hydratase [Calditrichota bacterium]